MALSSQREALLSNHIGLGCPLVFCSVLDILPCALFSMFTVDGLLLGTSKSVRTCTFSNLLNTIRILVS